jgi:hypothetical protein
MRRIIVFSFTLSLFASIFSLGGKGDSAPPGKKLPANPEDAPASLNLRRVDGELTEAVSHIKHNLRDLYTFVRQQPKKLDPGKAISPLRDQLAALLKRDDAIRKLGVTPVDELMRRSVLHDRAESFVHAWATFSLLTIDASRPGADTKHREELLALDRQKDDESALALLLCLYSHIRAAEGDVSDPLRARLKHNRCPSTRDLVGTPHDDPKEPRDFLSLWALVNLQLDTWHEKKSNNLDLTSLSNWLKNFSDNTDLIAFDQKENKLGTDFKARLAKLHLFIDFRNRHTTHEGLASLLKELGSPGRENRSPESCEAIKNLAEAAEPINNESLPQAAVWLRYVILLSYQHEGVQVIAGSSDADLKKGWNKLQEKHPRIGDFRKEFRVEKPVVEGFVRWNAMPKEGHIVYALADATDAAYRYALWEAERPTLEKQRYEPAVHNSSRENYLNKLRHRVAELNAIYCEDLQCYFSGHATPRNFDEWLFPFPTVPGGKDGDSRFQASSLDDAERKRVTSDLAQLAAMTTSANQVQKSILAAYEAKDPSAVSAWLQGSATMDGMARWTPFDLPQRSFNDYYRQVIHHVELLKGTIKDAQSEADLTQLYKEQIAQNDILADEVAIARLGLEIAEQGKQVADRFKQLAALDKKIADLANDWTNLDKQAKALNVNKAELQLGLAAQARELAAAKLEGLKEALDRAKQLVKNATAQLESMKPQLLEAAQKIKEQKQKSGLFRILRCIVTVVGAVLTPFVGPEAFQIAMTVNQALTIAENASDINFSNLGAAIPKIADLANDASKLANSAIDHWGGNDLKKIRKDVNQWMQNNGRNFDRLTGDAKKNVEEALHKIKNLKVPKKIEAEAQKLRNFVSEIGSGLPIGLANGAVKIEVGKLAIEFKDKTQLKVLLEKVFQEGGMVVNTLRADANRIAALTGLDNVKRQKALLEALENVIRTSPPEVLDLLGKRDYDSAVEKVKRARDEIKSWVKKAKDNDPALKLLGQVLGGGMTIVKDEQGRIIALSPAIDKEAAALKKRVAAFQVIWKKETIDSFVKGQIEPKFDLIKKRSEAAQTSSDDNALETIANTEIPQAITELQRDFEELGKKIEAAEAELKDAETHLEIATLDRDAAKLLSEAAKLQQEAAGLGIEKAIIKERITAINITQASLSIQQKEREVLATTKRLLLNEDKLRHIYATCRRWGVDPNKPPENAPIDDLSLVAILDVEHSNLQRQHAYHLDKAAQGAVGMVQWLRLLNVPKLPPAVGMMKWLRPLYVKDSQAKPLSDRDQWALSEIKKILEIRYRRDVAVKLASELKKSAEEWNDLFLEQASVPDEHLGFARAVGIGGDKIFWFDDVQPDSRLLSLPSEDPSNHTLNAFATAHLQNQLFPAVICTNILMKIPEVKPLDSSLIKKMEKIQFLHRLPEEGPVPRRKALGYFKFRFTLDEHDDDQDRSPEFAEVQVAPNPSSSYYFLLSDSSLVHERQPAENPFPVVNLRFLIVPPDNPVGNPSSPFTGPLPTNEFKWKQLNDPLEETLLLGQIRHRLQLWKELELTGAVGDWTMYILATDVPNEAKRLKRITDCKKKLKVTLRIPYIEVPSK